GGSLHDLHRHGPVLGMDAQHPIAPGRHATGWVEPEQPVVLFGRVDRLAVRGVDCPAAAVSEPLRFPQISFAPTERAFGPLLILDLVSRGIPSYHFAFFIAQRHTPDEEPAIFAVGSTQALFHVERLS